MLRNKQQIRWAAFIGSTIQLALAFNLYAAYKAARAAGQTANFIFEQQYNWFTNWNISLHFGVDGIAIAMILLTAFVVIAGVLVSWNVEKNDEGILFLIDIIKLWCVWLFHLLRPFCFIFLFRNCSYTKIFINWYLGAAAKKNTVPINWL
ncbi:MAG: hypothetical protein WDM90_16085 [Ferruginibacter sp.]